MGLLCEHFAYFQTSAAIYMRSAHFRGFTELRVVVGYRLIGTTYRCHLEGSSRMPGSLGYAVCTGNDVGGDWMKSNEDKTSPYFRLF